jgi:hypothetical protein
VAPAPVQSPARNADQSHATALCPTTLAARPTATIRTRGSSARRYPACTSSQLRLAPLPATSAGASISGTCSRGAHPATQLARSDTVKVGQDEERLNQEWRGMLTELTVTRDDPGAPVSTPPPAAILAEHRERQHADRLAAGPD